MAEVGKLNIAVGVEDKELKGLQKQLADFQKKVSSISDLKPKSPFEHMSHEIHDDLTRVNDDIARVEHSINKLMSITSMGALGFSLGSLANEVINMRSQTQQLTVAFTTMLGSEEKATNLMRELTKTAATTPFALHDVTGSAQQLIAFGTEADKVNNKIKELGDIASGMSINVKDLVYLYGTTMQQGRMFTQDLRQFQGRGIPIAKEIAKIFKVTEGEVGNLVTQGKVTADVFDQAIKNMAGGQFKDMMINQSKTLQGQMSNLQDTWDAFLNSLGEKSEGVFSAMFGGLQTGLDYLTENFEEVGKVLGEIALVYGVHKASVMAYVAVQESAFNSEKEALEEILELEEEEVDADLKDAQAKGKLSSERAKEIQELRNKAKAVKENLKEQIAASDELIKSSEEEREEIEKKIKEYEELIKAREEYLKTAKEDVKAADLQKSEKAKLEVALQKQKVLLLQKEQAEKAKVNAQEKLNTIAVKENSMAQQKNSFFKRMQITITNKLKEANDKLNQSAMLNPWTLIATAVAALAVQFYKYLNTLTPLQQAEKRVSDAVNKTSEDLMKEKQALGEIQGELDNYKKGTQGYANAKEKLVSMADKYNVKLLDEKGNLVDLQQGYQDLEEAMEKYYNKKGYVAFIGSEKEKQINDLNKSLSSWQEQVTNIVTANKKGVEKGQAISEIAAVRNELQTAIMQEKIKTDDNGNFLWGAETDLKAKFDKLNKEFQDSIKWYQELGNEFTEADWGGFFAGLFEWDDAKMTKSFRRGYAENLLGNYISEASTNYQNSNIAIKSAKDAFKLNDKDIEDINNEQANANKPTEKKTDKEKAKEQQERADAERKRLRDEARKKEDLENELEQRKINLMADGFEKENRQAELNHKKNLISIKRQAEDRQEAEVAAELKKAKAKDKDAFLTTKQQDAIRNKVDLSDYEEMENLENQSYLKKNKELLNKSVNAYVDYYNQMQQIKEDNEAKLKAIDKDEKKGFLSSDDAALKRKNLEIENQTKIDDLKEKYSSIFKFGENEKLAKELEKQLGTTADNALSVFQQKVVEYNEKLQALITEENDLIGERAQMVEEGKDTTEIDQKIKRTRTQITASKQSIVLLQAVLKSIETQADKNRAKTEEDFERSMELLNKRVDLAKKSLKSLQDVGTMVGGAFEETINNIVDVTSAILDNSMSVIDTITNVAKNSGTSMKLSAIMASESIKTVEKASVILAIIGAAIQVAMTIAKLFKKDNSMEIVKQKVDDINESIKDLKHNMELDTSKNNTIFSTDIWGAIVQNSDNAIRSANRSIDLLKNAYGGLFEFRNRIDSKLGENFLNRTLGIKDFNDIKTQEDALKAFGNTLNGIIITTKERKGILHKMGITQDKRSTLGALGLNLTNEDGSANMDALKEFKNSDLFQKIPEYNQKMINDMIKANDDYEQSLNQLRDNLSQTFNGLGTTLMDSIENAFLNGTDAAEDFSTAVADMLNNMAKNFIFSNVFAKEFENAQTELENIYKDSSLSEEQKLKKEEEVMKRLADSTAASSEHAISMYGNFTERLKEMGMETTAMKQAQGEQEDTSTMSGALARASQESIDLLAGQTNAVRINQVDMLDIMQKQLLQEVEIQTSIMQGNTYLESIDNKIKTSDLRALGTI